MAGEHRGGDWERAEDLVDEETGENETQKSIGEGQERPVDVSWEQESWGARPEEVDEGQEGPDA